MLRYAFLGLIYSYYEHVYSSLLSFCLRIALYVLATEPSCGVESSAHILLGIVPLMIVRVTHFLYTLSFFI